MCQMDLVWVGTLLERYARGRLAFWCAFYNRAPSQAKGCEDFALEAIVDTFRGHREWKFSAQDLSEAGCVRQLYGVVNSKVRNWVMRGDANHVALDDLHEESCAQVVPALNGVLLDLRRMIENDPVLVSILELYAEGMTRPEDMAAVLEMDTATLRNHRRRLARCARALLQEYDGVSEVKS